MRILFVWLFLVACGQSHSILDPGAFRPLGPVAPKPLDEKLLPFIQQFEDDCKAEGVTQKPIESIEFQEGVLNDNPNILGVCYTQGTRRWVRFSSDWWVKMTNINKKKLVYHELGHCGLGRSHYDDLFQVGEKYYTSIMSTYMRFIDFKDIADWPVLVQELFHPEQYHDTKLHGHALTKDECFVTPEGYTACPIIYEKAFQ